MVRRTLNYMWHAVFIRDNMVLTEVYVSYSIAGSYTNSMYTHLCLNWNIKCSKKVLKQEAGWEKVWQINTWMGTQQL